MSRRANFLTLVSVGTCRHSVDVIENALTTTDDDVTLFSDDRIYISQQCGAILFYDVIACFGILEKTTILNFDVAVPFHASKRSERGRGVSSLKLLSLHVIASWYTHPIGTLSK